MNRRNLVLHAFWLIAVVLAFFAGSRLFPTHDRQVVDKEDKTGIEKVPLRAAAEGDRKDLIPARELVDDSDVRFLEQLKPTLSLTGEAMSDRLAAAFGMTDPVDRKQAILNLIANLDADNVEAALEAFENAENRRAIDDEFRDFLYAWAKIDGAAAAAYSLDPEAKFRERYGSVNVASGWAAADPAGARAFVEQMESGERKQWMHYGVFKTLLESDLTTALEYAETNERSRARGYQLDRLARKMHETYGPDGLKRWVEGIDHEGENEMESYKRYAMKEAVGYIAREDAEQATEWVLENLQASFMDDETLRRAAYSIGDGDTQATMSWLSDLPDSKHKGRAIHEAVERYADRDPNGVASWLNEVGSDPKYDSTFSTFATRIVDDDPISAINWALAIRDAERQTKTVQKVLGMWRKADPKAAETWLLQNGIKS